VGVGRQADAEAAALADAAVDVGLGLGAAVSAERLLGLRLGDRRDEAKVRAHRPTERRRNSGASSASVPISVLAGVGAAGRDWRASIMPMTSRCASPGLSDRTRAPVVRTRSSRAPRRNSAIGSGPAAERTP